MTKLFSPSMTRRKEPPNSLATVMHVGTKTALVNFRGRSYTAKMVGEDWSVGQTGYFVECPRGKFWITREQGSWYANKLENWIKNGLKANATLEYFLRKCKKWSPHMVSDTNELLKAKEPKPTSDTGSNFGTMDAFNRLDADDDGYISLAEWQAAGGSESTFNTLDKDGDGKISAEEWSQVKIYPDGKIRVYSEMLGTGTTGGGEDPEEPEEPEDPGDILDGTVNGVPWQGLPTGEWPGDPTDVSYTGDAFNLIITWGDGVNRSSWDSSYEMQIILPNIMTVYFVAKAGGTKTFQIYRPSLTNIIVAMRDCDKFAIWPYQGGPEWDDLQTYALAYYNSIRIVKIG